MKRDDPTRISEHSNYHDLTERQGNIYDWMKAYHAEHGFSPSVRDVCVAFGFRSPNGAQAHLVALQRKGYLSREGCHARALTFLKSGFFTAFQRGRKVIVTNVPATLTGQEAVEFGRRLILLGEQALSCSSARTEEVDTASAAPE